MASNGSRVADARPNILLITCDQYRFPRFSYGPDGGFDEPLKRILGFQGTVDGSNPYAKFFPGMLPRIGAVGTCNRGSNIHSPDNQRLFD